MLSMRGRKNTLLDEFWKGEREMRNILQIPVNITYTEKSDACRILRKT